jgi:AAHS family 4-hydroxybenzoate transporter-like MFS transporter
LRFAGRRSVWPGDAGDRFAGAVWQLALLKALAGVGLGGVPGTAAAMIAEFTTARWRSLAVTFGVVCVSIGGFLAVLRRP